MPEAARSPFGKVLREIRLQHGLSQAALADLISKRARNDQAFAELGIVSDRTISSLEAVRTDPTKFVRPRPHTVRILATALNLEPDSEEEAAFFHAAELTRARSTISTAIPAPQVERQIFVTGGRKDLYQGLKDTWSRALGGTPQLVMIAGDAGSGKTHMIRELCVAAHRHMPNTRIAWGECTGGASSVSPYLPFLQAMNNLLALVDSTQVSPNGWNRDRSQQAQSLDALLTIAPALVGTLVDEPALAISVEGLARERPDLREKLQRVLGVRNAADASGRFDQMARLIADVASTTPTILVLEDLHWASEQTTALLLHLQRQLWQRRNLPLLIIGSYRPSDLASGIQDSRHSLEPMLNEIGRQVDNVIVDLGATIGSNRGRAFINELLRTLSIATDDEGTLSEFLFSRTEGHPLFSTELIRWLQETGGMQQDSAGFWHLTDSAQELQAPAKIHAVIAERLERLPVDLRKLLASAAVQGTTIVFDFLVGQNGFSANDLTDAIDTHLVKRYRLLHPWNTLQIGNRRLHRYQFSHALFQEYIYEMLTPREREHLHKVSAQKAVEVVGTGPHVLSGEIAFHFEQAHLFDDAAKHAYAAATLALQQLNYDVASHWLQMTETYALHTNDRWHVHATRNGRVSVLRGSGHVDEALGLALEIVPAARQDGFHDLVAEAEHLLGQAYYDKGELRAAVEHLGQAGELHRSLNQHAEISGIEAMLSHTYYRLGAYDDAMVHAHRAHESAEAMGNEVHAAEALLAAGNCQIDLGMYDIAISTYQRANALYMRAGEVRGELLTALNTGLCHIQLGEWELAVALLEKTRHTTEVLRTPRMKTFVCHYLGMALEGYGDYDGAKRETRRSIELREIFGQDGHINDNVATLLRISLAEDDAETTRTYLRQLEVWNQEHHGEGAEDPALMYLSMAQGYVTLGDKEAGLEVIRQGYNLLQERASHIADPEARLSYLQNVPANRTVIAWHETGEPPANTRAK